MPPIQASCSKAAFFEIPLEGRQNDLSVRNPTVKHPEEAVFYSSSPEEQHSDTSLMMRTLKLPRNRMPPNGYHITV